ncbi:amino acid transporter [Xylariaceae sp. FL0804]|nr:amino acid transporter [Xylariaceae sp. FL0804]
MDANEEDATRPLLRLSEDPAPALRSAAGPVGPPPSSPPPAPLPSEAAAAAAEGTFRRNLGAASAFGIVVGIVVGSGVFTSPGAVDTNVPSPGMALVVWLVGGALAWTGASTMAELGTAIPGEGGVQPYLRFAFGDVFGFLAAWTWIVAVMPATQANLSIVVVESLYSAAGVSSPASSDLDGDRSGAVERKLLAVLVLLLASLANSAGTRASTRLNGFFVFTKFACVAGVVLAGVVVACLQAAAAHPDSGSGSGSGGPDWFTRPWFEYRPSVDKDGSVTHWGQLGVWDMLGHYSAALYGAQWAYCGWDKAVYITAELSHPARQLPLAINTAIPTVILCFVAANAAYYVLLPWDVVSTTDSVAVTATTHVLGRVCGIIAAMLICLVVVGSLLGNSFVAGRMTVAAANQNWIPPAFAYLGRPGLMPKDDEIIYVAAEGPVDPAQPGRSDAPVNAIMLSAAISIVYILLGNFRALVTFNGLGEYSFFFLTVVGALILRYQKPELSRPYKPPILVPVLFAVNSRARWR